MVDAERVADLLERITAELVPLREAASGRREQLLRSRDALPAIKYRLVVAVEAAIDVGEHLIASEGFRRPDSFAETFAVLADEEVLDAPLAASMGEAAGLRNVLVHQYAEVDDERLLDDLEADLDDLDAFVDAVGRWAAAQG